VDHDGENREQQQLLRHRADHQVPVPTAIGQDIFFSVS
jgi:hypothetical protein